MIIKLFCVVVSTPVRWESFSFKGKELVLLFTSCAVIQVVLLFTSCPVIYKLSCYFKLIDV